MSRRVSLALSKLATSCIMKCVFPQNDTCIIHSKETEPPPGAPQSTAIHFQGNAPPCLASIRSVTEGQQTVKFRNGHSSPHGKVSSSPDPSKCGIGPAPSASLGSSLETLYQTCFREVGSRPVATVLGRHPRISAGD